jgi:3-deoxy-manno-octulosonate cytidylyltransferase (CMP-KDO synthetase)
MVVRVLRAVDEAPHLLLAVATDDPRIAEVVEGSGYEAVMTGSVSSGTERVHAAWEKLGRPGRLVVNLQCDEPFVNPSWLLSLVSGFSGEGSDGVATLGRPMPTEDSGDPDRVKVAVGRSGRALYFSRSPVPHGAASFVEHIGVYCFTPDSLDACACCGGGSGPAEWERLEQLAWMEEGIGITVVVDEFESCSVDTPEDLRVARRMMEERDGWCGE